jgi:tripartite-type tricarboxylate transporter receptor subunit TctC
MTQDMLGGQIELGIGSVALLTPHVRGGRMRAVATLGEKRASTLPDTPTLIEQGFPGLTAYAWWGIFAPAATPKPVIAKLNAEVNKVLHDPEVRKAIEKEGGETLGGSAEEFAAYIKAEIAAWAPVVKASGAKVD